MIDANFGVIFREHKDAVYGFAWRMTGSRETAEDITQDSFLALLRAPERYDAQRGELRSFLFAIARNLALKRWRTENRWEPLAEDALLSEPLDPASLETADLVAQAVRSLPPLQREALILAEYEGLKLNDVARVVDAELSTVKGRLHRARENLRRMLAPLKESICSR